jgi:toxin ParE1/3/4
MRSLLLSPLAARDLEEIGDFLSDRNPLAAIEVVERFWKVSRSLSENPKIGQARPDLPEGLRHFPMPPYIVFYRAIENGVEIVRFVDGRRDLRKLINA